MPHEPPLILDGWNWAGWNTKPDASGEWFTADTPVDFETAITLYCILKRTEKFLVVTEDTEGIKQNKLIKPEQAYTEIIRRWDKA